jgi:hypothetical protein
MNMNININRNLYIFMYTVREHVWYLVGEHEHEASNFRYNSKYI